MGISILEKAAISNDGNNDKNSMVHFHFDVQILKNLDYVIKIGDLEETPVNTVRAIVNPMEDREQEHQEQAPIYQN